MFETTTITVIAVKKTETEWRAVLADPQAFLDDLRTWLAAERVAAAMERSQTPATRPNGKNHFLARKPQAVKVERKHKKMGPRQIVKVPCPAGCGRDIADFRMSTHLERKHPDYQPVNSAESRAS